MAQRNQKIVRAAIHPAIGIARVGNSRKGTYPGPEVYPTPALPPGSYRDEKGALKRQTARFRVYGYNADGEVVRELTAASDEIRWSVHVANRKAAWYQWIIALDIPEAAGTVCPLRNPTIEGAQRDSLVIDGGPVSIAGRSTSGPRYACRGSFLGARVKLGELETDDAGRLVFLPGHGVSASPVNAPIYDTENNPNPFINANGWHDDVADGPVRADVAIDGHAVPCDSAWVLSAPPDYAPNVVGLRTLYDLLYDLFVGAGFLQFPETISFRNHVYPILHRLSGLGWVNKGYEAQFGRSGPYPFSDPAFVARLASNRDETAELRRQVFNNFRPPTTDSSDQLPWGWIYGDAMEVPAGKSPRQNATISGTQYRILEQWVAGSFDNDWGRPHRPPTSLADVPTAKQPATLDRAALEYALADAFHPGCEVTWPIRHLTLFDAPFRIRQRPARTPEADYGLVLTPEKALAADGPLNAQGPGDLSRWMGLPWQADTAYCRSGYDTSYDPYIPTFWPATVPNQVLTPKAYRAVMAARSPQKRAAAFAQRASWVQPLDPTGKATTAQEMMRMVKVFGSMGFLEEHPGPKNDPAVPATLMVASYGRQIQPPDHAKPPARRDKAALKSVAKRKSAAPRADGAAAVPPDAAWGSTEKARKAPLPVKRPGKE